jgi:hypothetical protein
MMRTYFCWGLHRGSASMCAGNPSCTQEYQDSDPSCKVHNRNSGVADYWDAVSTNRLQFTVLWNSFRGLGKTWRDYASRPPPPWTNVKYCTNALFVRKRQFVVTVAGKPRNPLSVSRKSTGIWIDVCLPITIKISSVLYFIHFSSFPVYLIIQQPKEKS